jgi:hypothetical protein
MKERGNWEDIGVNEVNIKMHLREIGFRVFGLDSSGTG